MQIRGKATLIIAVFLTAMAGIPTIVSAEEQHHDVSVSATNYPVKIHLGIKPTEDDSITFSVDISNKGNYVEEGIALRITEWSTGKVLYFNPNEVSLLPAGDTVSRDIIIPIDRLTNPDCQRRGGWSFEYYEIKVVQKAIEYDIDFCNNYGVGFAWVKPDCHKM